MLLYDHLHDTSPNSSAAGQSPAAMQGKPVELVIADVIFSHERMQEGTLKQMEAQSTPPPSDISSSSASFSTTVTSLSHSMQPAFSPRPRMMAQPNAPISLTSWTWREKPRRRESITHGGGSGIPIGNTGRAQELREPTGRADGQLRGSREGCRGRHKRDLHTQVSDPKRKVLSLSLWTTPLSPLAPRAASAFCAAGASPSLLFWWHVWMDGRVRAA